MAFNEMNLQYWDALENLQSGQLEVVIVSCEGNLYWPQIHLAQSNMGWAPPSLPLCLFAAFAAIFFSLFFNNFRLIFLSSLEVDCVGVLQMKNG